MSCFWGLLVPGALRGAAAMKIFLSYGHDHNKPIVDRIERDLKAAGYDVWKDETKIKAGDDWRRSILDGAEGLRLDSRLPLQAFGARSRRVPR